MEAQRPKKRRITGKQKEAEESDEEKEEKDRSRRHSSKKDKARMRLRFGIGRRISVMSGPLAPRRVPAQWARTVSLATLIVSAPMANVACLKYEQLTAMRRSLEAPAVAEAIIAICSGALLWIGWWDFLDQYLVPNSWWSKLCMLLVGAVGALSTRSLYAVQNPSQPSVHSAEGTSAAIDDVEECARSSCPPALPGEFSPHSRSLGAGFGVGTGSRRAARTW